MAVNALSQRSTSSFSLEDKKKLCEAWQKSNLSRSEFIRRHGLPSSFHSWCNQLLPNSLPIKVAKTNPATRQDEAWMQVIPEDAALARTTQLQSTNGQKPIEFKIVCNNVQLSFCMPVEQIAIFVKEICHATTTIR